MSSLLQSLLPQVTNPACKPDRLFGLVEQLTDPIEQAKLYQAWIGANHQQPLAYVVLFNFGVVVAQLNNLPLAQQAYENAIKLNPLFIQARLNLASIFERQGDIAQAEATWSAVLPIMNPQESEEKQRLYLHALNQLGRMLETHKRYTAACGYLVQSLQVKADQSDVLQHWFHLKQRQCQWPADLPLGEVSTRMQLDAASPLAMLAFTPDPREQLGCAYRFHQRRQTQFDAARVPPLPRYAHERLRLGYLSSDFCLHPVSLLTVELFALHNRQQFEIYGFSWSPNDGSPLRQRVIGNMDHFIEIGSLSDAEAAAVIRQQEIDILIDLQGVTSGARLGLINLKPAPLIVTYLGFPGPNGHWAIDAVIADRFVLPPELVPFFTEKPLYVSHFQVSDPHRTVGVIPTRQQLGFKDESFIFCSFNNNYKFTPEIFTCWLRILKRVPHGVLMLLADCPEAEANLKQMADYHGVDTARLFFAPRVAPPDYLARYATMDLFLDTFPFNAGTTANDALFMGLPLLTYSGKTFASRYAGSLLHSLGLDSLICDSVAAYEERAVALATTQRAELARLKTELAIAKTEQRGWFNVAAVVREIEAGLVALHTQSRL